MGSNLPKAIKIYKGLSIYRVGGTDKWYVRIWDSKKKKYLVKSTGMTNAIEARAVAQELGLSLLKSTPQVEVQHSFRHFALQFINQSSNQVKEGRKSKGYFHSLQYAIQNPDWGLLDYFGEEDVRSIKTHHYEGFLNFLNKKRPDLAASTKNTLMAAFRSVLKIARERGLIDRVPDTPRIKQKDTPRPFFRFYPVVEKEKDAYQNLLSGMKILIKEDYIYRYHTVDEEMYDMILFLTHTFVRPTTTELYAIKHEDVVVANDPRRLILTVRDGKTGYRSTNTMPAAVSIYERICKRYNDHKPSDYIFYPKYKNRQTISATNQRTFKQILRKIGLEKDVYTGKPHSLYSLRHTAICMRIINSQGKVNIYNLAKSAGTSVDQIERFYARHLPLTKELARNLQSFGD